MEITNIRQDREGVIVRADGRDVFLSGKPFFLVAGVTCAEYLDKAWHTEEEFPTVRVRAIHPYEKDAYVNGTDDPQLVCISRRAWTLRNMEDAPPCDNPTEDEAITEVKSGVDKYGGDWSEASLLK